MRRVLMSLALIVAMSSPACAQAICAPRTNLLEKLKAEFDEEPAAVGVTTSGGLFEVVTSPTGTWTVLATGANGVSCLVLSGEGWMMRDTPRKPSAPGQES